MAKGNDDELIDLVVDRASGLPSTELGTYIFGANPYRAGWPPKGTWKKNPLPSVVKLVVNNPANADAKFSLDTRDGELHEEPGNWKFKYAEHYVERAVRIPYLYYKKSDTDESIGILVKDFFLVGFEGGGAY